MGFEPMTGRLGRATTGRFVLRGVASRADPVEQSGVLWGGSLSVLSETGGNHN
jgi:hypothetical protein